MNRQYQAPYYPYYVYSGMQVPTTQQPIQTQQTQQGPSQLPLEQSYIENILRLNRGKVAKVYATFENNTKWNAEIFQGVIEAAGRDHVILSDPNTGRRYLIPMVYVDYVTFDEEIAYSYPFDSMSTYAPR